MELPTAVGADPYDDVVRLSERLEADGPDAALEQALPGLRFDAAARLVGRPGRATWPPHLADPFPEIAGRFPEIGRDEITTPILAGGMLHHGGVIIRRLLEEADL